MQRKVERQDEIDEKANIDRLLRRADADAEIKIDGNGRRQTTR